jgi:hypothetical protein
LRPLWLVLLFAQFGYGQEQLSPVLHYGDYTEKRESIKSLQASFDSTFIYSTDTLGLPVYDDFSSNHFQRYVTDYSLPGVTHVKHYRVLDSLSNLPVSSDFKQTSQQTFRRVYDLSTSSYTDILFSGTYFKTSDLKIYPPTYNNTKLYPPYYIYDTLGLTNDLPDTVFIPTPDYYQDSATQFFYTINDPESIWLNRSTYLNYTFAKDPRTLGVVTFDGLDSTGFPYAIGTTQTNFADVLLSKPINLAGFNVNDEVYLGFLYQPQGLGDVPESSDSLLLEFRDPVANKWVRIWSVSGKGVHPFKPVNIKLNQSSFFNSSFQFRFRNYGGLSGSIDHFHIDLVHLRSNSASGDTVFKDFAQSYPLSSLIQDYTAVPWDHFKNNPINKVSANAKVSLYNGSLLQENNPNGKLYVHYAGNEESSHDLIGSVLSQGQLNYGPRTFYTSYHDFSNIQLFDPNKVGDEQTFEVSAVIHAQYPNNISNDSSAFIQRFQDYYSYDDGSSEAAYGVVGAQAQVAVRYDAYEADSLIGVDMNFIPSVKDMSKSLFLLTVWADNNGKPGEIMYQDDPFFPRQPIYGESRDSFTRYFLNNHQKLRVNQLFYVGWRQFDSDPLNIGFDRNIDRSAKNFYSVNGSATWPSSTQLGSLMLRPVFSTNLNHALSTSNVNQEVNEFFVYPNPTVGEATVKSIMTHSGEVLDVFGKVLFTFIDGEVDLTNFPAGVYLVRVHGSTTTKRLIKVDAD